MANHQIVKSNEKLVTENDTKEQNGEAFGELKANTVNVDAAIAEYYEVKRELSNISKHSMINGPSEEEGRASDGAFDLDQYLQGMSYEDMQAGIKPKRLGLIWKDLKVEGFGADAHTIPTVISALSSLFQPWKYFGIGITGSHKTILQPQSAFVKEGEMLLVLGRPGAGTTSLLKVLANMRGGFTKIDGNVSYGGIDPVTFAKLYRGQVIYNEEEDQHIPVLTTRETLEFALRTKTPAKRLPEETRAVFMDKIIYMLGNMLGLSKQMNTLVGNAFVRGLSGGERKRLSIAEAMTTQSSIQLWDGATRGLDAVSALDYVRSLRIMTDVLKKTTISTLYQASNTMFNLYDKVMILDQGYVLYFGPVDQAKAYFENLGFYAPPRKSVPDFLTGLSNPLEREIKPGFDVPDSAQELSRIYLRSNTYKRMMDDLSEYENQVMTEKPRDLFMQAVRDEHQKFAPKSFPYTVSFAQQVWALTIRHFQVMSRSMEALISRYGTSITVGFLLGSCYYMSPLTASGALSRVGAVEFTVICVAFISHSELVSYFFGRPILEKQKHYAMYQPSAYYLSLVVMDIPISIVQTLLYVICSYFLMGFASDAGRFFANLLITFFMTLSMNGFFRFWGGISNNFLVANQFAILTFIFTFLYTGNFIYYSNMHKWFFWIHWIGPLGYSFKALLINEMQGQVYSCDVEGSSIPYGLGYTDWAHKICTMKGGVPGESFLLGDDYLRNELGVEPTWLWSVNFVMIIAWFLFFTVVNMLMSEYWQLGGIGSMTKLYLPGKAPKPRTIEEERERLEYQKKMSEKIEGMSTGTTFSWQNINYTVPIKGGEFQILQNVSGIVKPGHLTALMGSSGAGKTTLLDVLALRKTIGKVEGRTYLNNEILMADFERITGYIEQFDVQQPADTVREAMQFSAYLRQDPSVSKSEKDAYVEQIIHLLEMEDIADAQIGDLSVGFGISVEERKRLTIAMELVAKPKLIFLDEPTSGLDAQSSYNIVRFLRKLADAGWPVVCTIHQPSAILFEHFDHLLLLVHGGRTAYYGEIGVAAKTMIDYFESKGAPLYASEANPAEYILDVVNSGDADWADIWTKSKESKALENELETIHNNADTNPSRKATAYALPFWSQFYLVFKRLSVVYWRSSGYNLGRFISVAALALFLGFTFWNGSYSFIDIQNRAYLFFCLFPLIYVMVILGQPKFITERVYFRREYASRYYGWVSYAMSAVLVEIPYILVVVAVYMCCIYWTAGLTETSEASGYYYLMVTLFVFWGVMLGFVLGGLTETAIIAAIINPLVLTWVVVLAGITQTQYSLPHFWSSWGYWLDPFHYVLEGLTVNELENLPVICNDKELLKFTPPANMTCGNYMKDFFDTGASGYIVNPSSTSECGYCTYTTAKEYYTTLYGWDAYHKWQNIGIMCIFCVFNVLLCIALIYRKRKAIR